MTVRYFFNIIKLQWTVDFGVKFNITCSTLENTGVRTHRHLKWSQFPKVYHNSSASILNTSTFRKDVPMVSLMHSTGKK